MILAATLPAQASDLEKPDHRDLARTGLSGRRDAEGALPRLYRGRGRGAGVALTMTAGSAAVSKDSPPVFNNLLAYKDEIVPWVREMTDAVHEAGAAIMIQLTHLGRRTRWDKGDWLPVVAPSHGASPRIGPIPRRSKTGTSSASSRILRCRRTMKAGGMDGVELEAYGHLIDQFVSPIPTNSTPPYGGSLENRLKFCLDVFAAIRKRTWARIYPRRSLYGGRAACGWHHAGRRPGNICAAPAR